MNLCQRVKRVTFCTIAFFAMSYAADAGTQDNDVKIPQTFKNLLQKFDVHGETPVLEQAKARGIKFFRKPGQEALFPLILDLNPGVSPGNFNRSWLEGRGIKIDAVSRSYVRVLLPMRLLRVCAQHPQIRALSVPHRPVELSIGMGSTIAESVHLTNADSLQEQGTRGDSVKVAVIDMGFYGLNEAITTHHELPSSTMIIDLPGTHDNPIDDPGVTPHGVAIAEQVMDMAPGAKLYCMMVTDALDFQNAVDTVRAKNIRIVNHSVGWTNFGYYDDTGFIDSLVNVSHDKDSVFWTVAAGNEAQRHWRGKWSDTDNDSLLEFQSGAESMQITGSLPDNSTMAVYLSWNQFKNPQTDLDMFIYDKNNNPIDSSVFVQPAYEPAEYVFFPYSSSEAPYNIKVRKRSGPVSADTFDMTIFSPVADLEPAISVSRSSMMCPADAHGACAVASVSTNSWTLSNPSIEPFSSRGPTNDGRMKPDISAPDSTSTWTYSGQRIRGTSYSSPVVAGAAALLKQKYPSLTMVTLADSLREMAKDIGPAGKDTAFGAGLLYVYLPPPVLSSPVHNASGLPASLTLTWSTVGNAATYHVQVSTNTLFTGIISQDSTLTAGSKSISGLTKGGTYYWRVGSKNSRGVSPWSGYWTFTIIKQFALALTAAHGSIGASSGTSPYDSGTVVTLTATSDAGYQFAGWSGGLSGTTNPTTITMTSAKSVTATFAIKTFALTSTAAHGSIGASPGNSPYDSGTVVTLTATPAAGYQFTGWSGALTGTTNPETITMTGAKSVTAGFTINSYFMTVSSAGHGTVKPSGTVSVNYGDTLRDTAVPDAGYNFVNWTVTGTVATVSGGAIGKFVVTGAGTVQAHFAINTYALTITAVNGSVTKSPDQTVYDSGSTVTLTALPAAGYQFAGWNGDVTGTANPTAITMTGPKSLTCGFTIKQYTLTTAATNGTVTRSPDLSAYDSGAVVTLTALPSAGFHFTGWSGDLSGTTSPTVVTMNGSRNITAGFVIDAPVQPVLVSPVQDSANVGLNPFLIWNSAERAWAYHVQVSNNSAFSDTVVDDTALNGVSRSVGPLANFSTYYWRVNARNAGGTSAWSVVWRFTTLPPVPARVSLLTPADTAKIPHDSVSLVWLKSSPEVDRYDLIVTKDSLMTNKVFSDSSFADTLKTMTGLTNKNTYWWHVRAHNSAGWGSFSAASRFTISIPSTAVLPKTFSCLVNGLSNVRTGIRYSLPVAAKVSVRIYGIQGRLVASLCDSYQPAGYYHVPMNHLDLSNGYYLLDFKAGKFIVKKKLPLFR
jgi:uncharacterized repeat protein (TIGR02543 family)